MNQFGTPGISAIGIRTIDETRGADVRAITFVSACCSTGGFGSLVQPGPCGSYWNDPQPRMSMQLSEISTPQSGLTRECSLYCLKELARRAGVTAQFFRSWTVTFEEHHTVVCVHKAPAKYICFPHSCFDFQGQLSNRKTYVRRACWLHAPADSIKREVPDFVVPWVTDQDGENLPLFLSAGPDVVYCAFDLLTSLACTLSRLEETLTSQRDRHGRFPSAASIASRERFLQRPIVDEYGLAFEQALTHLLPAWQPEKRTLRVLLSHDVDHIGIPFSLREILGHVIRRHSPAAGARDLLAVPLGAAPPTYLGCVRQLAEMELERGLDCEFYWKASPPGEFDSGYDPFHPAARKVISWLHERGITNGVHPGYETFLSPDRLRGEMNRFTKLLGPGPLGGRQHYLRWAHDTWLHWEDCGLAYDSTIGYSDQSGFRAGTCFPYRPWLFSENREANLLEIPLVLMDKVLFPGSEQHSLGVVWQLVNRCRSVGGVFTLLWHNTAFVAPRHKRLYAAILDAVAALEPKRLDRTKTDYSGC